MNKIHLNLFFRTEGFHYAAWRHPEARPASALDVGLKVELAQLAERGLFDSIFLDDSPSIANHPWGYLMSPFENMTLLSAIAMKTKRIGLIGTSSTTYNDPFNLARQFASLDHISNGRTGWNIVTTSSLKTSENFGSASPMSHRDRYLRAAEFVNVVLDLWDSWDDDALVADKRAGVLVDPKKVHSIDFKGAYFSVKGPLNIARPVQGHPLLVQAGSSAEGIAFGARIADAVFTAQHTVEEGRSFYKEFKDTARSYGRDPDKIVILPGLAPILGSTETEARRLATELEELTDPIHSLRTLSVLLEIDLTKYPYDGLVPIQDVPMSDDIQGHRSRYQVIVDLCRREQLTIRDLVRWHITGATHRTFIGTPEQLADDIEDWVTTGAADGFNVMPSLNSNGMGLFVEYVVPELQRRGMFRTEYEASTLRGLYGLPPKVESTRRRRAQEPA